MSAFRLIIGATVVAATVATGSALTAANTVPSSIAGYGEGTVTGAVATKVEYTPLSTDTSKLSSVVFTLSTDISVLTATMTLKSGSTQVGASPYACSLGLWDATTMSMTATCATSDNPAFSVFDTVGLTVG
jgi:hypothetical protein